MVTYMFAATVKNKPHPPNTYAYRMTTPHDGGATQHYAQRNRNALSCCMMCRYNVAFSCAPTDGNLHSYNVRRDRMSRKCYSTMLVGGQKLLATCPFSENLDITLQLKASLVFFAQLLRTCT